MDQLAQDEVVFSVGMQIDRTAGIGHPNIFAGFVLAGPAMIGVMRADDSVGGRWERHDDGDELLVLMAGECAVTVRRSDGRLTVHHAERGDVLLIPKGAAHSFTLHTREVQVLFVTPCEGNRTWSGAADDDPSHDRGRHDTASVPTAAEPDDSYAGANWGKGCGNHRI